MTEKPEADGVVTVAELLARHGQTSGTAGRAHRRRAREGGITVAELTGEIPVVRDEEADQAPVDEPAVDETAVDEPADVEPADVEPAVDEPAAEAPAKSRPYSTLDAVADAGPQSPREFASTTAFPVMTPLARSIMSADAPDEAPAEAPAEDAEETTAMAPAAEYQPPAEEKSAVRQWLSLGAQAVVGVAVGAALFVGFEKLWDSLPYVALILAILVILAMVAVVRILRKTDDIVSVLIAVVVGVIVTIGPLAFVLSTS